MNSYTTIRAAHGLALWANHGWAVGTEDEDEIDLIGIVADVYASAVEHGFGRGAAAAIEELITVLYHTYGTEGPVGWGIEHPTVLDDGTIVVSIGYHGQLEGRFAPNGWTVRASGPGGRYVTLDAVTGRIIGQHNAQPRDYARARAAVAAAAIGYSNPARREAERDYNGYFRAAVLEAAADYKMDNEEYALYARLAHNAGHVLAGKDSYEGEAE